MGLFSRRREELPKAMVASAVRVDLSKKREVDEALADLRPWQRQAWDAYRQIGELKEGVRWLSWNLAKVRLFVGEIDEDAPDNDPQPTDNAQAKDALARLEQGPGLSTLLRRAAQNLSVPGECYLVGIEAREPKYEDISDPKKETTPRVPETWLIASRSEFNRKENRTILVGGVDGKKDLDLDTENDTFIRIYIEDGEDRRKADSPVAGVLNPANKLVQMERADRSALKSRIAMYGIMGIADELDLIQMDPTQDGPGEFIDEILQVAQRSIDNEDDASAVLPMFIRGSKDALADGIQTWTLDRPLVDEDGEKAAQLVKRILHGANIPIEVVTGLGDANHWGAGQIEESAFREYLEPMALIIVQALTTGYLRPAIDDDDGRYVIWYDPSALIRRPNRTQEVQTAHKDLVISDAVYRREMDFDEDDAPGEEELLRRTGLKRGIMDSVITEALLKLLLPDLVVERPERDEDNDDEPPTEEEPAPEEPPEDEPEEEPQAVTAAGTPTDIGDRLYAIDRSLKDRLHAAVDAQMTRALELAGNRLRSRTRNAARLRDIVKSTEPTALAARLGRDVVAQFATSEELLAGAFDSLQSRFDDWVGRAQGSALDVVPGLTDAQRRVASERQERDRSDAWTYLAAQLHTLADSRMFDPDPQAPESGEFDATALVPFGIIRAAVARAGGADGLEESGTSILIQGGSQPAGGIGTGQVITELLGEQGYAAEEFEWDYGAFPRSRPFEPHAALHGARFSNFDDPILANTEGWPNIPYYVPGDHDGCICDFRQVVVETALVASVLARSNKLSDVERNSDG